MSRRSQRQRSSGATATIVVDGNSLNVVHVYVHCNMRQAMHAFMATLQQDLDPSYSDTRELIAEALNRYQFIETSHVSIGRA